MNFISYRILSFLSSDLALEFHAPKAELAGLYFTNLKGLLYQ